MYVTISFSGRKTALPDYLHSLAAPEEIKGAIRRIADAGPGNSMSISGSLAVAGEGNSGTFSLSGSFSTVAEETSAPGEQNFTSRA